MAAIIVRVIDSLTLVSFLRSCSQNARVTVTGRLNGKPFSITRTKNLKTSGLAFILDGRDLTTQSPKETMAIVEEKLGVSAPILARTMFHGQHALNELLEATDAKLKEELSLVVPLELWQEAVKRTRSKTKEATKKENELQGMLTIRIGDLENLQLKYTKAVTELKEKEEALSVAEAEVESARTQRDIDKTADHLQGEPSLVAIRESLDEAFAQVETLQVLVSTLQQQRRSILSDIDSSLSLERQSAQAATKHYQQEQLVFQSASHAIETAQRTVQQLEATWQVDLADGNLPNCFEVPETCPTCLQPVASNSHGNIQQRAEQEIQDALLALASAETNFAAAHDSLRKAQSDSQNFDDKVCKAQADRNEKALYWDQAVSDAEGKLQQSRSDFARLQQSYASHTELQQQASVLESQLTAKLAAARQAVQFARASHEVLAKELETITAVMENFRVETKIQQSTSKQMAALSDAFGNKGIQTYVLQNAVNDLQSLSQKYLNDLSDGTQRLELSFDAGDRISRQAFVCESDGGFRERPLATLSGGQWRRCSLALTLGFADLVATRGQLRPSLIVLDEPLTHLDRTGRKDVGRVLRKILGQSHRTADDPGSYSGFSVSTIIIILQDLAAEELEESFDRIDEVVRKNGASFVKVDETSI
jgi:DNA repair exonuclease SbcCD ATPase subunit